MKRKSVHLASLLALVLAPTGFVAQQTASSAAAKTATPHTATPHSARVFSTDAAAERIVNLDTLNAKVNALKTQLKQYHECTCACGCYAKDLDHQADRAIAFLRQRAAHRRPNEKLALVLDIDETSLSNYQQMIQADFAYDSKAFNAWVESGQAPAIPGTLRLAQEAQRLGVSVIFLTGRPESQRAVTEQNLHAQGYRDWQQLILRAPEEASQTALVYKSGERAKIVAQGYKIGLSVGDQWSDLKGQPEAEFSVKYPNPYYYLP